MDVARNQRHDHKVRGRYGVTDGNQFSNAPGPRGHFIPLCVVSSKTKRQLMQVIYVIDLELSFVGPVEVDKNVTWIAEFLYRKLKRLLADIVSE